MSSLYNRIAGQSLERLAAISDGIFGVAMTLLVLDVRVPTIDAIHSEGDLWHAILALLPKLLTYLMSFLTAGIFWIGQQTQLDHLQKGSRHLVWINIAFLLAVSMLPFSTALLSQFIHYRVAIMVYWLNICALGFLLMASWKYAVYAGLVQEEHRESVGKAMRQRILTSQALYAAAAALCFIDTYVSIVLIVLLQLIYAFAPGRSERSLA
jgi:uncharacterized membrane protein